MKLVVTMGKARMEVDLFRFSFGDGKWVIKQNRLSKLYGGSVARPVVLRHGGARFPGNSTLTQSIRPNLQFKDVLIVKSPSRQLEQNIARQNAASAERKQLAKEAKESRRFWIQIGVTVFFSAISSFAALNSVFHWVTVSP